ncbi:MAG: MlaD family protein, partial [Planctomycetota bacterium]
MSDYETTQKRRNMIVGIFVVVGIGALVWLIFKFGDLPSAVTKMGSFEVFVQFPTATGVQTDTPVRFCGYQIGRVTKVMAPDERPDLVSGLEYYQTVVVLSIDKSYVNIPSNVEIKLMTRGLGSSYIELKQTPGKPAEPLDPNQPDTKKYLVDKILLQGSTGMTSEFFPEESQKKLDELVDGIIALIANANDVIGSPDNKENLQIMLANLTKASEQAKETMQQAKQTIEEFRKFAVAGTTTLTNVDAKAEELVVAMVDTSEEISKAAIRLRQILETINDGQG